jgi:hypothetical protein
MKTLNEKLDALQQEWDAKDAQVWAEVDAKLDGLRQAIEACENCLTAN